MLKIAMFDEVNEATANFKVAARRQDAPDQGYWLTLDADGFTLPSDWYLRLAGEITRIFLPWVSCRAAELPSSRSAVARRRWATPPSVVSAASYSSATFGCRQYFAGLRRSRGYPDRSIDGRRVAHGVGRNVRRCNRQQWFRSSRAALLRIAYTGEFPDAHRDGARRRLDCHRGERWNGFSYGGTPIGLVAPGLFTADASGNGVAGGVARVLHADGTLTTTIQWMACGSQAL